MKTMRKLVLDRRFWIAWMALGAVLLGLVLLNEFSLSALPEPGAVETLVATEGKHVLIGRSAAEEITPASRRGPNTGSNLRFGRGLYLAECSSCHGIDGRTPTEMGSRMYPRAADLGSTPVQRYSDDELFWVIRNGIRLTGMPGLGDSQPDGNIWELVGFLRSLRDDSATPATPGAPGEEL